MKITQKLLEKTHPTDGRYLVVKMTQDIDYVTPVIPKDSVGVVKATREEKCVVLFPFELDPERVDRVFGDGILRVVDQKNFVAIGRVG